MLLHGDLWHGNVSIDVKMGESVLYDSGAFYSHFEAEAAPWRASQHQFRERTLKRYFERVRGASEPREELERGEECALCYVSLRFQISVM